MKLMHTNPEKNKVIELSICSILGNLSKYQGSESSEYRKLIKQFLEMSFRELNRTLAIDVSEKEAFSYGLEAEKSLKEFIKNPGLDQSDKVRAYLEQICRKFDLKEIVEILKNFYTERN